MRAQICFFVSIVFSFVAWGAVTGSLILPELRRRGRNEALRPLLMFHSFRFVGSAFLVPGVVLQARDVSAAKQTRIGSLFLSIWRMLDYYRLRSLN
jgi:hypothetical protein